MIQRPAGVPRQAVYSLRDAWWQVGEIVDGHPFGPWKTYRRDGSPLFEARFDKKGRLQGTFKRFHPDGSLARETSYARGKLTGRAQLHRAKTVAGDVFPCADPRAWQIVIDYDDDGDEKARMVLDERGIEVVDAVSGDNDRTVQQADALGALDPMFADAKPDDFLASGGFARVLGKLPAQTAAPVDAFLLPVDRPARRPLDAKRFQELYGKQIPAQLRAWLETEPRELFGLRVARDADIAAPGRVIEALISEHQARTGRAVGLRALVSGIVPLGPSSNDELYYCASICETPEAPTDAVYTLTPADNAIQIPVARTLDDFAYAVALISAAEHGLVSNAGLTTAYEKLRGRIDLRAPMTAVEGKALGDAADDDEISGNTEGDHAEGFHFRRGQCVPGYFFFRNRWLLELLCGHAEGAARLFEPKYDGGLSDERFETILKNCNQPWVAFYWGFRCLVFEDPRLAKMLTIFGDQPSLLTREIAALLGELAGGRKPLGSVGDIQAVLREARKLDPMSKKEEDEDGDEDEGDAEDEADEKEDEVEASAADEQPATPADPAVAVVEWAKREGYSRENLLIHYEVDVAALGLAMRADPSVIGSIIPLFDDNPWLGSRLLDPWFDTKRGSLAALVPKARAWLRDREPGAIFRWTAAAGLLANVDAKSDGKAINDVLELCLDDLFTRGLGMESALATMEVEKAVPALCRAAQQLGISESLIAALEGLVSTDNHLVDDVRGPCALLLASVDRGLDAILKGVRGQLERKHGHRVTGGQLEALGMLGAKEPARLAELLQLIQTIPRISDTAKLGQKLALYDLGSPTDVVKAVREMLDKKRYKDHEESAAEDRADILDVITRRTELPAELAMPYVGSEHVVLHRAAVRVLVSRGLPVPEVSFYDPYRVNEFAAAASGGTAASGGNSRDKLHVALADRRGVHLGNVMLWLGDHPDASSREPIEAFIKRIASRGSFPSEGPRHYELRWAVRALIAIGGGDRVLDELLMSADRAVAEPVLRYTDKLTPAVARGMAHVFHTDQHWRQSEAKSWLAKHKSDPRIAAALAELGLAIADVSRKGDE